MPACGHPSAPAAPVDPSAYSFGRLNRVRASVRVTSAGTNWECDTLPAPRARPTSWAFLRSSAQAAFPSLRTWQLGRANQAGKRNRGRLGKVFLPSRRPRRCFVRTSERLAGSRSDPSTSASTNWRTGSCACSRWGAVHRGRRNLRWRRGHRRRGGRRRWRHERRRRERRDRVDDFTEIVPQAVLTHAKMNVAQVVGGWRPAERSDVTRAFVVPLRLSFGQGVLAGSQIAKYVVSVGVGNRLGVDRTEVIDSG